MICTMFRFLAYDALRRGPDKPPARPEFKRTSEDRPPLSGDGAGTYAEHILDKQADIPFMQRHLER